MAESNTPEDWDTGFERWRKYKSQSLINNIRWLTKSIGLLCRTQQAKTRELLDHPAAVRGVQAIWLRTTGANSLRYWYKMEQKRREQLRQAGCRLRQLRDPSTKTRAIAIREKLKAVEVAVDTFEYGIWKDVRVRMQWDIHVKGVQMYAWWKGWVIVDATFYTNLGFKNKMLDRILGS